MDPALRGAVDLFNAGRFSEFQDALGRVSAETRARSERHFYNVLDQLAESLLRLSDGDVKDAESMIAQTLRKLDEFVPRCRGLNVEALRDDFRKVLVELREVQAGRKSEFAPSKLPRLRVLPE